jgi:hypothetical protein
VYFARPGNRRFYAHAYSFLDLKPGTLVQEVNVVIRRGMTVKVRVVGPDGKPVQDATVISRLILRTPGTGGWKIWSYRDAGRVRNGQFELHGLDGETEIPVSILDSRHELGAGIQLSGKSVAGGPVTVRLERCGSAQARLVDPVGKPVERYRGPVISVVVSPVWRPDSRPDKADPLPPETSSMRGLDPTHYESLVSDGKGRVVYPDLIPGATYRIIDTTAGRGTARLTSFTIRKEFTAKPGETLDLGDILIEKPRL